MQGSPMPPSSQPTANSSATAANARQRRRETPPLVEETVIEEAVEASVATAVALSADVLAPRVDGVDVAVETRASLALAVGRLVRISFIVRDFSRVGFACTRPIERGCRGVAERSRALFPSSIANRPSSTSRTLQ